MMNDYDRKCIQKASETLAHGLMRQPSPLLQTIDFTPIADAIREGLASIATAIEYNGELEDRRLREVNKQGE